MMGIHGEGTQNATINHLYHVCMTKETKAMMSSVSKSPFVKAQVGQTFPKKQVTLPFMHTNADQSLFTPAQLVFPGALSHQTKNILLIF
jgi:hypothetical protein